MLQAGAKPSLPAQATLRGWHHSADLQLGPTTDDPMLGVDLHLGPTTDDPWLGVIVLTCAVGHGRSWNHGKQHPTSWPAFPTRPTVCGWR